MLLNPEGKMQACPSQDLDRQGEAFCWIFGDHIQQKEFVEKVQTLVSVWAKFEGCSGFGLDLAQDPPCQWKHANLSELEQFLEQRIKDGSFVPTFMWTREFS